MDLFLQQAFNGLAIGAVYALFAVGFTLVFGVLGILNLAHAALFTWGALVGLYAVTQLHLPLLLALPASMIVVGVAGVLLDFVALRPLRKRGAPELSPMISTLAVALVLTNIAQVATDTQVLRYPLDVVPLASYKIGPIHATWIQLVMLATAVVATAALQWLLHRTRAGKAIRAVAYSGRLAEILGINVDFVIAQTLFISSALGAAAGVLVGVAFNAVAFNMGEAFLLKGLTVVILGGFGSLPGAMVGGLVLGLLETFSVMAGGGNFRDGVALVLVALMLTIRPAGLFGRGDSLRT